jgi:hypothetical protein
VRRPFLRAKDGALEIAFGVQDFASRTFNLSNARRIANA